jgi:putative RNA 2'-phosphotransferase
MTEAISKRLSYVLRHRPDAIGIALDRGGWVAVDELLAALARHGTALGRAELEAVVAGSDKRRFALSPDGIRIRAQQGHSVAVELGHAEAVPPATLYHGTVDRFLPSIRDRGLVRGRRHHVGLREPADRTRNLGIGYRRIAGGLVGHGARSGGAEHRHEKRTSVESHGGLLSSESWCKTTAAGGARLCAT